MASPESKTPAGTVTPALVLINSPTSAVARVQVDDLLLFVICLTLPPESLTVVAVIIPVTTVFCPIATSVLNPTLTAFIFNSFTPKPFSAIVSNFLGIYKVDSRHF